MTSIWRPTQAECDLIRSAAQRESLPGLRLGNICLEIGERYNMDHPEVERSINDLLVTRVQPGDREDTDLADFMSWSDFRRGVPLTEDGRAVVDFYIRSVRKHESGDSLFGNVIAEYGEGRLLRIHGYPHEYPVD